MTWTHFWDMNSGGGQKLDWKHIFIEASEEEAKIIFQNRFDRNPERVTCTCCGEDYSIYEEEDLRQLTAFHRNCEYDKKQKRYVEEQEKSKMQIRKECNTKSTDKWGLYQTLKEFINRKDILVIRKKAIKPKERIGELKEEGYVWK